jgi:hypothetical protein
MYDIVGFERSNKRLTLNVRHTTPGRAGTTIDTDAVLHLSPSVTDAALRVSLLSLDLRWVREQATVPAMALELARVLERLAAGLREGPGGCLALIAPAPVVPDEAEDVPEVTP